MPYDGTDGRLELGHEERRSQALARDIPEGEPQPVRGKRQVVHEIAAHVIGRPAEEGDVPTRQPRVAIRKQGALHSTPDLKLIAGHELVLQLEHEHEQDRCHGQRHDVEVVQPFGITHRAEDEEPEAGKEQQAAGRGKGANQRMQQPSRQRQAPAYSAHPRQAAAGVLIEVETVNIPHVPSE
jgi:hypothetical protein